MKVLLIAVLATLLAAPALAETHKIPEDNPIVTVVVPDKGWSADKIARGNPMYIDLGDDKPKTDEPDPATSLRKRLDDAEHAKDVPTERIFIKSATIVATP